MPNARYAVVLVLDDSTGSSVRKLAAQLHLLSGATAPVRVPPHVTLAVCTELDLGGFDSILRECIDTTEALKCTLASLGIFPPPEGVLFLGVAPSPQLVQLQAQIWQRLCGIGAHVEPYWIPGRWMPHCTLMTGLPQELIPLAVGRIAEGLTPVSGLFTRISVVEVESAQICYEIPLRPPRN